MRAAISRAGLTPADIHIVNTHATATPLGDIQECEAIRAVFGEGCPDTYINNTKGYIGHCMGAAGALEHLAREQAQVVAHQLGEAARADQPAPVVIAAEPIGTAGAYFTMADDGVPLVSGSPVGWS